MKTGLLTMQRYEKRKEGSVGSSRIRGDWIIKYSDTIEEFKTGTDYEAVIFQKAYWKEYLQLFEGIKIFDLCDPDWLEGRAVKEISELVDAITVPTQKLKEMLENFVDTPVYVIPDRMDPDFYKNPKPKHEGKAKSVVYFGYSHNAYKVLPQTLESLKEYNLNLTVISENIFSYSGFYNVENVVYDNETVNEEIIKHDIVLLPEVDNDRAFNYKSNNKTVSSWWLKMPVARTPEELEMLLDPKVRNEEAEKNYTIATEKYNVKDSALEYEKLIKEISSKK